MEKEVPTGNHQIILRGYVSFRECSIRPTYHYNIKSSNVTGSDGSAATLTILDTQRGPAERSESWTTKKPGEWQQS